MQAKAHSNLLEMEILGNRTRRFFRQSPLCVAFDGHLDPPVSGTDGAILPYRVTHAVPCATASAGLESFLAVRAFHWPCLSSTHCCAGLSRPGLILSRRRIPAVRLSLAMKAAPLP